ncbi:type III pantothenate kinase [Nitriliruptoraceae bacterium ZYF776]|nr:type III pantothenate kinase [Profundirhabdus halotolerans]
MLLACDVGNSTTVVGLFRGPDLLHHWRVSTDPEGTPDELALQLAGLTRFVGLDLSTDVDGLIVSSVVPPVTETFRRMAERYVAEPPIVVEPGVRTGLALRVDTPRDIGADRIVNAVAAYHLYGGPAIVVDFGTATSFDAVNGRGEFVGGAIAPGVSTSADALVTRAARLPKVETATPPAAIGRTTVTALQSGIVFGAAGQVDAIVRRIQRELGPGVTTVATGGLASAVLEACETLDHHDPWLTLKGLRLIWERNQG